MALDPFGNYSVQNLLESVHKLRLEALELTKQVRAGQGGLAAAASGALAALLLLAWRCR